MDIVSENKEIPRVFTDVSTLNFAFGTREPETIQDYVQRRLTPPKPKSFATNNGVIAVADDEGIIHAALHENGNRFRLEELLKAQEELKKMGYVDTGAGFYVPQFQKEKRILN